MDEYGDQYKHSHDYEDIKVATPHLFVLYNGLTDAAKPSRGFAESITHDWQEQHW